MSRLLCALLVLMCLWSHSLGVSASQPGKGRHKTRPQYKEPAGLLAPEDDHGGEGDHETRTVLDPEQEFLADFAGKKRLWVITAPSHSDNYLRMMEKQIQDMEQEGLNCRLAERDTFIVTIIQNAMMEGRIQKTTFQGEATMESIDSDMVTKLLHYLELGDQGFSMLVTKKNLRVSERFPYPVRVEAILEVIDQFPLRKLEKLTRKGSPLKCKITKKRLMKKRVPVKKKVFSPHMQGNVTSVTQRNTVAKKAALKSKIQDILSGRSRFIIRKTTTDSKGTQVFIAGKANSKAVGKDNQKKNGNVFTEINTYPSTVEIREKKTVANSRDNKLENVGGGEETLEKNKSPKKGKGKKDRKKGRGKKNHREVKENDKKALMDFVEHLKGKKRLMVIATPSASTPQYVQQREENELHFCDLALRKVTMAIILSSGPDTTLTLHHYQLDSEAPFTSLPEKFTDPDLISQLMKQYGMSSKVFSMTMTDYDLKPNKVFDVPPPSSALMEYVDTFPSRRSEMERERKTPLACSKSQEQGGALLRFMSKRRLLIISTPSEDDYSFQQQLQGLRGQACPMGVRHFALLKLIGTGPTASGSVELFPLNGKSQTENEPLSRDVVTGLQDQLKINREYFSMLVVGKDGDVKAWFPSPMWSLANIYDLVDSMELRQQEEKLQRTLDVDSCKKESHEKLCLKVCFKNSPIWPHQSHVYIVMNNKSNSYSLL
uniref:Coiled-coil domain containing 80 like 2 n=1 Tax=Salmo trutta TaxID=8032 RepID=A0A674AJA1_SALTR